MVEGVEGGLSGVSFLRALIPLTGTPPVIILGNSSPATGLASRDHHPGDSGFDTRMPAYTIFNAQHQIHRYTLPHLLYHPLPYMLIRCFFPESSINWRHHAPLPLNPQDLGLPAVRWYPGENVGVFPKNKGVLLQYNCPFVKKAMEKERMKETEWPQSFPVKG